MIGMRDDGKYKGEAISIYMPVWDIICSQLIHQNGLLVIWGQRILLKGFGV